MEEETTVREFLLPDYFSLNKYAERFEILGKFWQDYQVLFGKSCIHISTRFY